MENKKILVKKMALAQKETNQDVKDNFLALLICKLKLRWKLNDVAQPYKHVKGELLKYDIIRHKAQAMIRSYLMTR